MVAESPGRMGKPLCYVLRSNSDTSHHPLQSHCFPTVSDIHQAHSYLTRICMLYLSLLQECFSPNTCTTYFFTSSRSCINVFFSEEVFPDHCVQNGHTSISALLNASCFIFLHPIYHFLNISEAPHHLEQDLQEEIHCGLLCQLLCSQCLRAGSAHSRYGNKGGKKKNGNNSMKDPGAQFTRLSH